MNAEPFTEIPLDKLQGYKKPVHVAGWNPASRFYYVTTVSGVHFLTTTKGKSYRTRNALLYTRNNTPAK